jgi:hypothetical protein
MKRNNRKRTRASGSHFHTRLPAVAAGAAAFYAGTVAPNSANAAIIHFSGPPLSITINGPDVEWDVDGDGNADFALQTSSSVSIYSGVRYTYRYLQLNSHDGRNGRGFVQVTEYTRGGPGRPPRPTTPNEDVQNLSVGFLIGPSLPSDYRWGASGASHREMIYSYRSPTARSVYTGNAADDFLHGVDGFAGFRFENANGEHYGWARLKLSLDSVTLTVRNWAYESTPDAAIAVGDVPEPDAGALALFAAGAAGVARWRRRVRDET